MLLNHIKHMKWWSTWTSNDRLPGEISIFLCHFTVTFCLSAVTRSSRLLFGFQTSTNARTRTPAARFASTTKEIISANATKATRWTLSPRPARLWVSHSHAHVHACLFLFIQSCWWWMFPLKYIHGHKCTLKRTTQDFSHAYTKHTTFPFQLPCGYWNFSRCKMEELLCIPDARSLRSGDKYVPHFFCCIQK